MGRRKDARCEGVNEFENKMVVTADAAETRGIL
jgi:hypothetical protein